MFRPSYYQMREIKEHVNNNCPHNKITTKQKGSCPAVMFSEELYFALRDPTGAAFRILAAAFTAVMDNKYVMYQKYPAS